MWDATRLQQLRVGIFKIHFKVAAMMESYCIAIISGKVRGDNPTQLKHQNYIILVSADTGTIQGKVQKRSRQIFKFNLKSDRIDIGLSREIKVNCVKNRRAINWDWNRIVLFAVALLFIFKLKYRINQTLSSTVHSLQPSCFFIWAKKGGSAPC